MPHVAAGCVKLLWLVLLQLRTKEEELLFLLTLRSHAGRDFR